MAQPNPLLNLFAVTIFTEDLAGSIAFYKNVFEAPALDENDDACAFKFGPTILNVLLASEGADLVKPHKVAAPDAGKRTQFTVLVKNVDEQAEKLKSKGVSLLSGPEDKPWGMRVVTFEDPGGHVWEFAQQIPAAK